MDSTLVSGNEIGSPACAWGPKGHPPSARERNGRERVRQQRSPFLSGNFI